MNRFILILEGFHDRILNGKQDLDGGLVGVEFYYSGTGPRQCYFFKVASKTFVILMVLFIVFIELANIKLSKLEYC